MQGPQTYGCGSLCKLHLCQASSGDLQWSIFCSGWTARPGPPMTLRQVTMVGFSSPSRLALSVFVALASLAALSIILEVENQNFAMNVLYQNNREGGDSVVPTVSSPSWLLKAIQSGKSFHVKDDFRLARQEHAKDPNFPVISDFGDTGSNSNRWVKSFQSPDAMGRAPPVPQTAWIQQNHHVAMRQSRRNLAPKPNRISRPHHSMTASEVTCFTPHQFLFLVKIVEARITTFHILSEFSTDYQEWLHDRPMMERAVEVRKYRHARLCICVSGSGRGRGGKGGAIYPCVCVC